MKPTQTAIAVALALVVVAVFFIFPGLSPFSQADMSSTSTTTPTTSTTTTTTSTTTMMDQNNTEGLQATDETVGTGATAETGDTVTVNYVGAFTDGTIFDASANHSPGSFSFTLGAHEVIQGWDEGVVGMKVGGKRELVVPAALGYGSQANGPIPANSTLVFEIELLNVQKAGQ